MNIYGVYTILGVVVNTLLTHYNYDAQDTSIIGGTFIFSGLIGSFVFSIILDRYPRYLLILRIICIGGLT
jgi:hypothetical protein